MQEKISYGISLIRYNKKYKKYEILMIKKRNSYSFINFAMGIYNNSLNELKEIFSGMTFYEKRIILSMNFDNIWMYLWNMDIISKDNEDFYNSYLNKKKIFDTNFLSNNTSKQQLRNIILDTHNNDTFWEIPKGNKNGKEKNIDAAIREMKEETGIEYGDYKLLFDINNEYKMTFIDVINKIKYTYIYYLAELTKITKQYDKFLNRLLLNSEVIDIKWISLSDMYTLNFNPISKAQLTRLMKSIITTYRTYKKNKYTYCY